MAVLVGIVIALLVAAGVLLVASVAGGARAVDESPWQAFRRGWAARHESDGESAAAVAAEPVDLSLSEFLTATAERGEGYLQVDELTETLTRAREKATRSVPGLRRG
jgi:hypothetical protein